MSTHRPARLAGSLAAAGLLVAMMGSAQAADVVTIPATFPYAGDQVGTAGLRDECRWNTTVPMVLAGQSAGGIVTSTQDLATVAGKKLFITVTDLGGTGGEQGAMKWITVHGELKDGDALLGSFDFHRSTRNGRLSACASLSFLGNQIGQDILGWLAHPVATGPVPTVQR